MSMNDATPGDIYIDPRGKLWRIKFVHREPTIVAEEVEGTVYDPLAPIYDPLVSAPPLTAAARPAITFPQMVAAPRVVKAKQSGAMNSPMWKGWRRMKPVDVDLEVNASEAAA